MPLDLAKLEKVRVGADRTRARCPACGEAGGDTKGQHLSIDLQGRFGCAVHPGDREHRRRIWELAGDGKALPNHNVIVRPVTIRKAWQFPDVSDAALQVGPAKQGTRFQFSDGTDGTLSPLSILEECSKPTVADGHSSETSEFTAGNKASAPSPATSESHRTPNPRVPPADSKDQL